jgi:hypothetical protein
MTIRKTPPELMSERWIEMIHLVLAFADVRPFCDCDPGDCHINTPFGSGNILKCRHGRGLARNEMKD